MKVFVDSDVIISSLISSKGAAYLLLNKSKLELYISNKSIEELEKSSSRLGINNDLLKNLIKKRFQMIKLKQRDTEIQIGFKEYVLDQNDAHIIAGAKKAKVKFLITYNIKHFNLNKIQKNFNLIVTTPAKLLQYLRSLS